MIKGRKLNIVKTQRDFGRDTNSVKKMVKEAERLIDEHFGMVKNRRTGSRNIRESEYSTHFHMFASWKALESLGEHIKKALRSGQRRLGGLLLLLLTTPVVEAQWENTKQVI